jgi:hypothetical protein
MLDTPMLRNFPEGSQDCDYDVFETLADGSTFWRACVIGMANAEFKLRDLARDSTNKFFAASMRGGIGAQMFSIGIKLRCPDASVCEPEDRCRKNRDQLSPEAFAK